MRSEACRFVDVVPIINDLMELVTMKAAAPETDRFRHWLSSIQYTAVYIVQNVFTTQGI